MSTITFDTLKFANRLKAAGVPDKQAAAQAEAMADALEVNLKDLATRADVLAVRADLLATKEDLHKDLLLLEQRLTIKLGTFMAIAVGAIAALIKLT